MVGYTRKILVSVTSPKRVKIGSTLVHTGEIYNISLAASARAEAMFYQKNTQKSRTVLCTLQELGKSVSSIIATVTVRRHLTVDEERINFVM